MFIIQMKAIKLLNILKTILYIQQTRMDWNELKWIQIFRNIDSRFY